MRIVFIRLDHALAQMNAAIRGLSGTPYKTGDRFYEGNLVTGRYFFHYERPKTKALVTRLLDGETASRCMVMAYDYAVLAGPQGYFNHKKMDTPPTFVNRRR